jgi:hypothetical protein
LKERYGPRALVEYDKNKVALLWRNNSPAEWEAVLATYESYLRPENIKLEHDLANLGTERVAQMSAQQWKDFLHNEYFL